MTYYQHPYVSNSDLSKLKPYRTDGGDAYRIGSLVDAMITENHTVDYINLEIHNKEYRYDESEFYVCKQMKRSFNNDPFCNELSGVSTGQKEIYVDRQEFFFNGTMFALPTKRKYDLWSDLLGWGADIKSTVAKTQKAFESSIKFFDYDRQGYWYMTGAESTKFVFIGISKFYPHNIFKVFINHGDTLFKSGEAKASELAHKYWCVHR